MRTPDRAVLVVGQTARDLLLEVDALPGPGASVHARRRLETVGGKGANQAVALARLGLAVRLLSTVGDDAVADHLLGTLHDEGVDVALIVRREGAPTGLVVELLDGGGGRFVEDLTPRGQLTVADVDGAARSFRDVSTVVVSLAEPIDTALAAGRAARAAGTRLVLDGAAPRGARTRELLATADVLRADAEEAQVLLGRGLDGVDDTLSAARELLGASGQRPTVVVLEVSGAGNVVAWQAADGRGEAALVPLPEVEVVDTTGAGDVFVAGLVAGLVDGASPLPAVRRASEASAEQVQTAGGRPGVGGR